MRIKPIEEMKEKLRWHQNINDHRKQWIQNFVRSKMSEVEFGLCYGHYSLHEAGFFLNKLEAIIDRRTFYPIGDYNDPPYKDYAAAEKAFIHAFQNKHPGCSITLQRFGLTPWKTMTITMTREAYENMKR